MPPKPEPTTQQPGADRFWGQFSQSRAGRSSTDDSDRAPGEEKTPDPDSGGGSGHDHCLEWCPICRSAELFRTTVSPELRQQAESIQQEAVSVLKAFLDAYAEKSTGGPSEPKADPASDAPEDREPPPPRVTDIPLE